MTRDLTGFKVSSKPLAYLVDTPGVMIPNVENADVGLRLALTGPPTTPCDSGERRVVQVRTHLAAMYLQVR